MKYIVRLLMAFCAIAPVWGQTLSPDRPVTTISPRQPDVLQSSSSAQENWVQLGEGLPGGVTQMTVMNGELYAVHHTANPGTPGNGRRQSLSRWNGSSWTTLSTFNTMGGIHCMLAYRGEIYLGGTFYIDDQDEFRGLIRWDGTEWHLMQEGLHDNWQLVHVYDMKEFQGDLYCAGIFQTSATDVSAILRYDGTTWSRVGNSPGGIETDPELPLPNKLAIGLSLEVYWGALYLGGAFKVDGRREIFAKWDGTTWSVVPVSNAYRTEGMMRELAVYKGQIYCYASSGLSPIILRSLSRWDTQRWSSVSLGADFPIQSGGIDVEDMVAHDGKLYASVINPWPGPDSMSTAIYGWDGKSWEMAATFGNHEFGQSWLEVFQNKLVAGGMFTNIDGEAGMSLNRIAIFCDDGSCGRISGTVFNDVDNDCMHGSSEQGMRRHMVEILPGSLYTMTDNNGYYSRRLLPGTYTVRLMPRDYWDVTCPAPTPTHTATITDPSDAAGDLSFGVRSNASVRDVRVSMVTGRARAGRELVYHINYENVGTLTAQGTVRLRLDPILRFDSSAPPPTRVLPSLLEWDFTDLKPGEDRSIKVWTTVPQNAELGLAICSDVDIEMETPVFSIDTHDSVCVDVTGSYDPNDISVVPYGVEDNGEISPHDSVLTYTVRFQNTGNDTAFKVVVIDTLSGHLDISSIRLGAASHPFSFNIDEANILKWTFDNIMLPDSNASEINSHGMFKYSVRLKPGLAAGTTIANRASIYFDYNVPVVTNTVRTTISGVLAVSEPVIHDGVALFPNPVRGSMKIVGEMKPGSIVEVQDMLGRRVLERTYDGGDMTIDMASLPAGTYFVKIPARSGTVLRQVSLVR